MKTADFYGRKSNSDAGQSVAGQEAEFRDDCAEQGLAIGRIFADPDRSASRHARLPRPDYDELLAHIRAGQCQMLTLWESSRGSRDEIEWFTLLRLCRKQNVLIRIISHHRTYDMKIRADWKSLADEGVNSANESEQISERTLRGKRVAAREGRPVGRYAYGWRRVYNDRGHLVSQEPHPEQAPIVREIIGALADGEAAAKIARSLNERGISTPQRPCAEDCNRDHRHFGTDLRWTDRQVRQLAIRPSYAGRRVHQGEDFGPGKWEPLVDPKVWQKAYDRLTESGRMHNDPRLAHWLTSVIKCSLCKHGLQFVVRNKFGGAYQCRNCYKVSASARGLEGTIEPLILGWFDRPDAARIFQPATDDQAVQEAEAEETRLRARLQEFYEADDLSAAGVAAAERKLLPQIDAAAAKVRRLSMPAALEKYADMDIVEEWPDLGPRARRELVAGAADIVLEPGGRGKGPKFDPWRLGGSRWVGDPRTWGEHWKASEG